MPDQQDLLDLLQKINAVSKEETKTCPMPVGIYIHEGEGLYTRATLDKDLLLEVGMTPELLDNLAARLGALRTAQANWEEMVSVRDEARKIWNEESPAMYDLREELIDHMEFAYRNDEVLLEKLDTIKEGDSQADAIQDLANLAVLGKNNIEPMETINYDITKFDLAAATADRMASVLGDVNGHMYVNDERKLIRDKAYTLLKEVVDEIRSYGRFVFRKDARHVKAYSSKYQRERMSEYRKKKKQTSEND